MYRLPLPGSFGTWLGPMVIESSVKATVLLALAAAVTYTLRRTLGRAAPCDLGGGIRRHPVDSLPRQPAAWLACAACHRVDRDERRSGRARHRRPQARQLSGRGGTNTGRQECDAYSARQRSAPPAASSAKRSDPPAADSATVSSRSSDGRPAAVNDGAKVGARLDVARRGMSYLVLAWMVGVLLCFGRLIISGMALPDCS